MGGLERPGEVDDGVGALEVGREGAVPVLLDVGGEPRGAGRAQSGRRRARPTTDPTSGSSARAATTLVPTFPVAPVTTILLPASMLTAPALPGTPASVRPRGPGPVCTRSARGAPVRVPPSPRFNVVRRSRPAELPGAARLRAPRPGSCRGAGVGWGLIGPGGGRAGGRRACSGQGDRIPLGLWHMPRAPPDRVWPNPLRALRACATVVAGPCSSRPWPPRPSGVRHAVPSVRGPSQPAAARARRGGRAHLADPQAARRGRRRTQGRRGGRGRPAGPLAAGPCATWRSISSTTSARTWGSSGTGFPRACPKGAHPRVAGRRTEAQGERVVRRTPPPAAPRTCPMRVFRPTAR